MNDEKRLYMPMVPYVMSRRESLLPGQTYHPFTIVKDRPVLPQNGQAYTFLDGNYVPCTSADDAVYAWHYACLPPPAGFVLCNPGFNKYGEPLPTVQNFTDSEIFTMRQTLTLLPDTQPASRALTGKENTATVSHKPKAVLVNGRGEVLSSSDEVEELQYQLIVGGDGYYLNIPKREKLLRVTNFIIHLLQIRHYISQNNNSEEERRKIFLEVKLFGPNRSVSLEIPYEQISQILDFVKKKVGDANVFDREQIFAKRLEVMMRSSLQDCEITYEYNCSGWAVLPTTQRIYICDSVTPPAGNVYFNCNFAFGHGPSIRSDRDVVLDAFELLALSEDRPKIIIPFLWAHMGLLFSIFSEAGYPPRALLFINGVSGSLKTAVAKLLFNFIAKPEYDIPASFRDTSASMEISIATYVDRVLLVDDYCPAANQASRRVMEQTLENLIRFYGDGNTKARATPSMDVVNIKKAGGVCVITGEDTAGSLSS